MVVAAAGGGDLQNRPSGVARLGRPAHQLRLGAAAHAARSVVIPTLTNPPDIVDPVGIALPSVLSGKSCTLTALGRPWSATARHHSCWMRAIKLAQTVSDLRTVVSTMPLARATAAIPPRSCERDAAATLQTRHSARDTIGHARDHAPGHR